MPLADDWGYKLGQAFLDAAVSCGATCARRFVSDGGVPEQPPPGCKCQLIAVVAEGWEPLDKCGVRRSAEVRMVLDLCTLVAAADAVPNPAATNTQAQANAATRWAMMRGFRQAWNKGLLGVAAGVGPAQLAPCSVIIPGPWRLVRSTGGMARWEAVWRFRDDV